MHSHAYPAVCTSPPAVGASNLGHIILYSILNQQEGLLCDRAYYPGEDMQVCECAGVVVSGDGVGGAGKGSAFGGRVTSLWQAAKQQRWRFGRWRGA